jgi:hypothetical protein
LFDQIHKDFQKFNIKPDIFVINIFLNRALEKGDSKEFLRIMKSIERKNVFTYELIFKYYLEKNKIEKIEKYVLEFQNLNFRPSQQICDIFDDYYQNNKNEEILNFMKILKIKIY